MLIKSLTPVERKILANQFSILEKLDPDNAKAYKEDREIVSSGFAYEYESLFSDIFEEMPFEQGKYVVDVLQLHRILKLSYERLEDKTGINPGDIEFAGFDGNNESKNHAYARFQKNQGKWQETNAAQNSHSMTTISRYPRMLKKWEEIEAERSSDPGFELTAAEIKRIINS